MSEQSPDKHKTISQVIKNGPSTSKKTKNQNKTPPHRDHPQTAVPDDVTDMSKGTQVDIKVRKPKKPKNDPNADGSSGGEDKNDDGTKFTKSSEGHANPSQNPCGKTPNKRKPDLIALANNTPQNRLEKSQESESGEQSHNDSGDYEEHNLSAEQESSLKHEASGTGGDRKASKDSKSCRSSTQRPFNLSESVQTTNRLLQTDSLRMEATRNKQDDPNNGTDEMMWILGISGKNSTAVNNLTQSQAAQAEDENRVDRKTETQEPVSFEDSPEPNLQISQRQSRDLKKKEKKKHKKEKEKKKKKEKEIEREKKRRQSAEKPNIGSSESLPVSGVAESQLQDSGKKSPEHSNPEADELHDSKTAEKKRETPESPEKTSLVFSFGKGHNRVLETDTPENPADLDSQLIIRQASEEVQKDLNQQNQSLFHTQVSELPAETLSYPEAPELSPENADPKPDQNFENSDSQDKESSPPKPLEPEEIPSSSGDDKERVEDDQIPTFSHPVNRETVSDSPSALTDSLVLQTKNPQSWIGENSELETPAQPGLAEMDQSQIRTSNIFRKEMGESVQEGASDDPEPLMNTQQSSKGLSMAVIGSNFAKKQEVELISASDAQSIGATPPIDQIASNELIDNIQEGGLDQDLTAGLDSQKPGLAFQDSAENMPLHTLESYPEEEGLAQMTPGCRPSQVRDRLSSPPKRSETSEEKREELLQSLECSEEVIKQLDMSEQMDMYRRPQHSKNDLPNISPGLSAESRDNGGSDIVSGVRPNPIESELIQDFQPNAFNKVTDADNRDFQDFQRKFLNTSPLKNRDYTHHSEVYTSDNKKEGIPLASETSQAMELEISDDFYQETPHGQRLTGLISAVNSGTKTPDYGRRHRLKLELEEIIGLEMSQQLLTHGQSDSVALALLVCLKKLQKKHEDQILARDKEINRLQNDIGAFKIEILKLKMDNNILESKVKLHEQDKGASNKEIESLKREKAYLLAESNQNESRRASERTQTQRTLLYLPPSSELPKFFCQGNFQYTKIAPNEFDSVPVAPEFYSERAQEILSKKPLDSPFLRIRRDDSFLNTGEQNPGLAPVVPIEPINSQSPVEYYGLKIYSEYYKMFFDDVNPKSFLWGYLKTDHQLVLAKINQFLREDESRFRDMARNLKKDLLKIKSGRQEEVADKTMQRLYESLRLHRKKIDEFREVLRKS